MSGSRKQKTAAPGGTGLRKLIMRARAKALSRMLTRCVCVCMCGLRYMHEPHV